MTNNKKLIFDIGSNNGDVADFFSKKYEKVICFEPNPNLTAKLKERFKNSNVYVDSRALSDKEEIKTFYIANVDTISTFEPNWINNSRFSNKYNWNQQINVHTTTLDSIILEYGVPDFVKIDVEGYELTVLNGLTRLHKNTIFSFEWTEEQYTELNKIIFNMRKIGYNTFSFTYDDQFIEEKNLQWGQWEDLNIHLDIQPERKHRWGMVYFKYSNNNL